jgi:nitrite transporter NirC
LIFWCLLAFIGSGFEHVVANMTVFSLGMVEDVPGATPGAFAVNLVLVGLGNLVGGGVLVGAGYGFLARSRRSGPVVASPSAKAVEPVAAARVG